MLDLFGSTGFFKLDIKIDAGLEHFFSSEEKKTKKKDRLPKSKRSLFNKDSN
jgi:hypothetical protein